MTIARPMVRGIARPMARPLLKGVGDAVRSIFADGTDGFYFDFSKTDRLFQAVNGGALADSAGENIALALESHAWAGKTLAELIASQPELVIDGTFSDGSGWTVTAGLTISGGKLVGATVGDGNAVGRAAAVTPSRRHLLTFTIDSITAGAVQFQTADAINMGTGTTARTSVGTYAEYVVAGAAADFLRFRFGATTAIQIDNASAKYIPGNHGLQATAAAQPKWQTGGLARFDGSDDNLLTTLVPGTAMTLLFKGVIPAASASLKVFLGAQESSTGRCHLYMNTSGNLACAAGDNSFNSAISIASSTCVIGAIFSGGQAYYCHNGSVTAAGAYTGDPTALRQLAIGARNVNGTLDLFSNTDAARALAIRKALTSAEIAAITNQWGTT